MLGTQGTGARMRQAKVAAILGLVGSALWVARTKHRKRQGQACAMVVSS